MTTPAKKIICEEYYDTNVLKKLLKSSGILDEDSMKSLKYLRYKKLKGANSCSVTYMHKAGAMRKKGLGRLYPQSFSYAQGMSRALRNTLARELYWDVDMVSSQPTLALAVCKQKGWDCEALQDYIDNRDEWLTGLGEYYGVPAKDPEGNDAKSLINAVCFGMGLDNWQTRVEAARDGWVPRETHHRSIVTLKQEMKVLGMLMMAEYPEVVKDLRVDGKDPWYGSVAAFILQDMETQVLCVIRDFLATRGRSMDTLIHDGGLVRKLPGEDAFPEELLREVEEHVFNEYPGLEVRLAVKGMDEVLPLHEVEDEDDKGVVIGDGYAARKLIDLLEGKLVNDEGNMHIFDIKTGMWSANKAVMRREVMELGNELVFTQERENGKVSVLDYSGCKKNIDAMLNLTESLCIDDGYFERMADSSMGKLLFSDGIFDFRTGSFTKGFDHNILFRGRINRPFPIIRDEEKIALVRKVLFEDTFSSETKEVSDYWRIGLARALAGDYYSKLYYLAIGRGNAGKGVTVTAFQQAFEWYVGSFNVEQLAHCQFPGGDDAYNKKWIYYGANKRILFSNECNQRVTINCNALKNWVGGGDTFKVRLPHGHEVEIKNRATPFMMLNDVLKYDNYEEAVQNRERVIEFNNKFVDGEPQTPYERVGDAYIKKKFTEDVGMKDALVWVMIDSYREFLTKGHPVPESVKKAAQEWSADTCGLKAKLEEKYELTYDYKNHFVIKGTLVTYLESKGITLSSRALARELRAIDLKDHDTKSINGKTERVWWGIRLKVFTLDDLVPQL